MGSTRTIWAGRRFWPRLEYPSGDGRTRLIGLLPQNACGRARGESYTASDRRRGQVAHAKGELGSPAISLGQCQRPVVQPMRSVPTRSGREFGGYPIASPFTKGSFHDVSAVEHAAAHSMSAHDLPSHRGSLPEVRSPIRTMMQRGLLTKACAQVDKTERPAHVNGHVKVGASHHESVCKGWPGPIQQCDFRTPRLGY